MQDLFKLFQVPKSPRVVVHTSCEEATRRVIRAPEMIYKKRSFIKLRQPKLHKRLNGKNLIQ